MAPKQEVPNGRLFARNIGGISETEVFLESGVSILTGRNATNRTSLLQAIMAVIGSDDVSINTEADEAHVSLTIDGETYTRTLERRNGSLHTSGSPYLQDSETANLFAFLLESNKARRAVITEGNLREIILQPVDTDEIQSQIDQLVEQRREVSDEIDELDDLKQRLPKLQQKRTEIKEEIGEKQTKLQDIESQLNALDGDVEQSKEIETKLEELNETRSDLEEVRYNLETERDSLESLQKEKRNLEEEYDNCEPPSENIEELNAEIDRLRTQKQSLESDLTELQSVIQFNENVLNSDSNKFTHMSDEPDNAEAVTDKLVSDSTTCWTCGSEVAQEQIEGTIDRLRGLRQETVSEIDDIETQLETVTRRKKESREQKTRRQELETQIETIADEISTTEAQIDSFRNERDSLRSQIESIEAEIEGHEDETYDEILELHSDANQLEFDLGQLENDLERVENNMQTIEQRLDREADLQQKRDKLSDEIADLRTRIDQLESETIEEFNSHMDDVLELLNYENIARVWLERKEESVRDGRQTVKERFFTLHVIRKTETGTTYEDTIHNLSESERTVTAIVFALSGYLAHEVYEKEPFLLLDSLEAIDANRIKRLIGYLENFAEFVVVALLVEDAEKLPSDYNRIVEI